MAFCLYQIKYEVKANSELNGLALTIFIFPSHEEKKNAIKSIINA